MKFSEKVKYFYEEIKLITEGIGKTDLPEKLIEAATEQDLDKMKSISRQFKKDNLELWGRIALFYEEYCEDKVHIFGDEEEGLYKYNPDDIDPLSLITLLAHSFRNVDQTDLFDEWGNLEYALMNRGYKKMACGMHELYLNSLNSLREVYICNLNTLTHPM